MRSSKVIITGKHALHMVSLMLTLSVLNARADDSSAPENSLKVGLAANDAPRYSGAKQHHWQAVPVIQWREGPIFFDSQKGIGYDLQTENGLYLEHTLGLSLGRSDRDSSWRAGDDSLKGMGNIDPVVNTALALGWSVTPWFIVEGKATLPLSDSQGVQYQTSVTLIPWQTKSDTVALQIAGLFGDARYINTFYGVSREQHVRSGYADYTAHGGFYGTDASVTWSHQFASGWGTSLIGDYSWLDKNAADSPIVFRRGGASATAAITYSF
ncbi:MipA/OmpV family protein [Pantoea ananatis]|uniref:MipA/OmpV family protein n=1 Tax=Pantoea ananas TaxID=553 RepID=UPI003FA4BA4D